MACSFFMGCQKQIAAVDTSAGTSDNLSQLADTIYYQWGDQSINRQEIYDVVKYNNDKTQVTSVTSWFNNFRLGVELVPTYSGNTVTVNSDFHDQYILDAQGRVASHTSTDPQPNGTETYLTEVYTYTPDNYLDKIYIYDSMYFADVNVGSKFLVSIAQYTVSNGNYTGYTLKDFALNDQTGYVGRKYNFNYDVSKNAYLPISFFVPITADNTQLNFDKYMNYGKQSAHLITSIDYYLLLDDMTSTVNGTYTVTSTLNSDNSVTSYSLQGTALGAMPSDNLSPIPRDIKISYLPK